VEDREECEDFEKVILNFKKKQADDLII